MGYHPRIETKEYASYVTTRSIRSRLWFVNNDPLEEAMLGYAAKFSERYRVKLYALAIEGNHVHAAAHFPELNRSSFMRDFNSCVARAVKRLTPEFDGSKFWGRRYSSEFLLGDEDVEEYFFYTVLQPVKDGLVEKLSQYPFYNCFGDAVRGISRKCTVIDWTGYNAAKRYNPKVSIKDYTEVVTLTYARLPGYEELSQREYVKLMHEKLEERRLEIVRERQAQGLGFLGREKLLEMKRGALPHATKTSTIESHRPRILSVCDIRRAEGKTWYFTCLTDYKDASLRYRRGEKDVEFPAGMYKPYCPIHPPPEDEWQND